MGWGARGFTLLETVVAVAIAAVAGYLLVLAAASFLHWGVLQAQRDGEHAAIGELTDRWEAEEDSAWAIFTPPTDVLGTDNADGHEIDFFTRDAKNRSYFWAYAYDAQAHTLTRYLYGTPGAAPVKDTVYAGILKFSARTYPVTALQDAGTPVYSALYANATLRSGIVRFYPRMPWIAGGNNITWLRVEGASMAREMQLVTQTAPTGFTIVLRYTPSPAPSPTPAALAVWPAAIRFAAQGTQIASAANAPPGIARIFNALLGGGIANAAGGCSAVAYADANFTQRLPPGSSDPWGAGYGVDTSGCYNSGAVVVHEAGYSGAFNDNTNTCGLVLTPGTWSPSKFGPVAAQIFSSGSGTTSGCVLPFVDGVGNYVQARAQVIEPCWEVGGSCTWYPNWQPSDASCTRGSDFQDGYDRGKVSMSAPLGGLTANPDDSYTFTRTASGSVTLSARQVYVRYTSLATCAASRSLYTVDSTTYQSI